MNKEETERWMARIPPCSTELEGRDIVFLAHQRWEEHFTPVHGTTLRLAQRNRVLFMEPPDSLGWIPHLLWESDHRHLYARRAVKYTFKRLERFGGRFGIYHTPPVFLPLQARSKLAQETMNIGYRWMIEDGMRQMGMENPIFWTFQFNTVGVLEALDPELIVYECPEEAAEFVTNGNLQRYVRRMDAQLCGRADVVIVPNPHMYEARRGISRDIHMLPWAADVEHYNQAMDPDLAIPREIDAIRRPIIGIYANIDVRRFDVNLLVTLARRHPEWSLVLVGRVLPDFDTGPFEAMPNIHLLGKKPLEQLPAYVKAFDVGIIPYQLNGFTRSITPLKFTEYLSTGKPVVTTDLPAAAMYAEVVRIARSVDEFESYIVDCLHEPPHLRQERLEVARQNNWDSYMQRKTAVVAAHLQGRTPAEAKVLEQVR